jgi:hypothetical protein
MFRIFSRKSLPKLCNKIKEFIFYINYRKRHENALRFISCAERYRRKPLCDVIELRMWCMGLFHDLQAHGVVALLFASELWLSV